MAVNHRLDCLRSCRLQLMHVSYSTWQVCVQDRFLAGQIVGREKASWRWSSAFSDISSSSCPQHTKLICRHSANFANTLIECAEWQCRGHGYKEMAEKAGLQLGSNLEAAKLNTSAINIGKQTTGRQGRNPLSADVYDVLGFRTLSWCRSATDRQVPFLLA